MGPAERELVRGTVEELEEIFKLEFVRYETADKSGARLGGI